MEAQARHEYRSAVAVISGIVDVLQIEGAEYPTPDVQIVIGFDDVLSFVVQATVAQQKT